MTLLILSITLSFKEISLMISEGLMNSALPSVDPSPSKKDLLEIIPSKDPSKDPEEDSEEALEVVLEEE